MRSILVPTDFSKEADNALDFAMQLATRTGAEIKLLHVIELPSGSFKVTGDVYAGIDDLGNLYTDRLLHTIKSSLANLEEIVSKRNIKVVSKMEMGNVYKHISKIITQEKTDLIVMGSKGATGWKEFLIGSNAERVIRNSPVPVFTIKEKADLSLFKNMVYAIGDCSDKSVPVVKEFQKILGLNCHLLKVYDTTKFSYTNQMANDYVRNFARNTEFVDFTVNVADAIWVEEGIFDFVSHNHIDMIAMGTHGYKGLAHFLNGSNAEDVANHAKIPVLTINID